MREYPNIVITGTPGVGKTTLCEQLSTQTGQRHLSVSQIVQDKQCHDGWDDKRECWIVDDDKLLNAVEDELLGGGCLIDWHACDLFPLEWIDLVVVLRATTSTLYDRLSQRKYAEEKLQENLDSEIMQVVLEEAHEAYGVDVVVELDSNSDHDMRNNLDRLRLWLKQWKANSPSEDTS